MSSTLPPLLFSHRKTLEKETADNRLSFLAQNASSGEAVVVLLLGFLLLVLMVCAEWCATRQEDSEILKSFVPPVEQSAGGILMPPYSSAHGIQRESSSEASAVYVPRCNSEYTTRLRSSNPLLR